MNSQEVTSSEMTGRQREQLIGLITNALDVTKQNVAAIISGLNLQDTEAQEIIEKDNLQELFQNASTDVLKWCVATCIGRCFGAAIKEFDFTVPANYDHDTQIDSFRKNAKKEKTTHYYYDALTSKNFSNATNKLEPGKTYTVKIFPILTNVDSDSCVNFLRKQNAILVGGQGVTLVCDLTKDKLPKGKFTVSFDEKNALWKDSDGYHMVPYVLAHSDGGFRFDLGGFEYGCGPGSCLLCVCDKKSS